MSMMSPMGGMGMGGLGSMGMGGLGSMGMGGLGSMGMAGLGGLMNRAGPGAFGSRTQLGSMRSPMTPASAPTGFSQPTLQRPSMPPQNPLPSTGHSPMPNSFGMAGKGVFSNTMGGGMGTLMGSSMSGVMGNMMNSRGLGGMQMPMQMPMVRTGK